MSMSVCLSVFLSAHIVLADTNGPRDALRHTQTSSCCAQSWTLSVIVRRRSTVTTLGDDQRAIPKLFLVQRLENSPRINYPYFGDIFEFRICLINILQLQGALFPGPEALDPVEALSRTLCIGSKSRTGNDCIDLPP